MKRNTKRIIIIVGPTAIGKTALSIELANALNTEIISCDSRQFYKELKIGSAAPNAKELAATKHHFIHHLSVTEDYNAGKFEINAIAKINDLHKTKDTIVVVGGSGLYVDAICKGFDKMPEISTQIRIKLKTKLNEQGLAWLQDEVKKADPDFYTTCDQQNSQRLLRALEVFIATGEPFSSYKSAKPKYRPFRIIKIGLTTERELLYRRINSRVDKMLENGLFEEVESLIPFQQKNALQTVGYKEIFAFYNNECTLKKAVENIKQNTRRFAKRQLTWFRKDKNITWFEPHQINEIKTFIGL
ncbi:MAG: tRNA (adenosine(37)-N6)-dimethylallyltransferase MiaA [Flavobacteriales bacterium]|nr:tRNA (adenosine(37)-N6)-dimethylallyltransferase MiaA [Flavobacteriales bacterium]MBT5089530.1 tRNA (adenosine(37)-N6)-dimethylallyltransferase MiaA [Flavobacteriales bacterium]MBT5749663.1 tRNA (adenosine(37)-N6)-dimethylallyltransferase MiaA [Flavobacteriales bacterium]